jgi:serine/threonine protein kinase
MSLDPALDSVSASATDSLLQEAIEEFLRLREEGASVNEDSLKTRFPDHQEEITRRLAALEIIDRARLHVERERQVAEEVSHETRVYSTADDPQRPMTSNRLWIRCTHCKSSNAIAPDAPIDKLNCVSCLKEFSLLPAPGVSNEEAIGAIAHFHLYERIGMGGFGTVWKAFDSELERIVAIKIPRKDRISAADVEQFLHEARVAAQLSHPHIVTIHEIGRWEDLHYIVSDFIEGASLTSWIKKKKPTRVEAAELCARIARALHEAHECGIVHRDLKPGNILIDEEGEPHLTDFGLAKTQDDDSHRTKDGQVMGTPAYMSPEQAKGESRTSDRRSDVYSLGVVLFELLTGELPFRGNARALIHQVIHNEAPTPRRLNHNIERDLETICLKCLQKEPKRRFATALDVAEELERFIEGEPIRSRPIDSLERTIRQAQRHIKTTAMVAAAVLLLALFDVRAVYMRLHDRSIRLAQQEQTSAQTIAEALKQQLARYRSEVHRFSVNDRVRELLEAHDGSKEWPAAAQEELQALTVDYDNWLSNSQNGFLMAGETDPFENWFVMDASGDVRGHSPLPNRDNYSYRDYFRGAVNLAKAPANNTQHKTYVSRVYKSITDGSYKFGISAPIYSKSDPDKLVGVVMASILAGRAKNQETGAYRQTRLTSLRATDNSSFSVLVGPFDDSDKDHPAREGSQSKVFRIIQHPAYAHLGAVTPTDGVAFEEAVEFHTPGSEGAPQADNDYHDPLGKFDPKFDKRWIAGFAVVPDTKLLVVTQDSYDAAIAPMEVLFMRYVIWGLLIGAVVIWLVSVLVWRWLHAGAKLAHWKAEPARPASAT